MASLEKGLAVIEAFGPDQPRLTLSDVAKRDRHHTGRRAPLSAHPGKVELRRFRRPLLQPAPAHPAARICLSVVVIPGRTGCSPPGAGLEPDRRIEFGRDARWRRHRLRGSLRDAAHHVGRGSASARRLPAYCTSLGRAILAYQPEVRSTPISSACGWNRGRRRRSRTRPHSEPSSTTRRKGYALINEELELGLRSIAIPVVEPNGTVDASRSISAPRPDACRPTR